MQLYQQGILQKYNVELIGANAKAIDKAENRQLFKDAMEKIGLKCPENIIVNSMETALEALNKLGLPSIIRPSFTLGGTGGGIAYTKEEFVKIVKNGLDSSPTNEIEIDKSVIGWKEYEMEVVRDKKDNCIIVCSIENVDPMGVHTGDSITVAPALTLTDKEYQIMRNASFDILREIGVDTGGSNVQFAVNPDDGELLVVEMNPRVSRSSALASKATGFPIAKVAAKLAVGYTLDEIINDFTKITPSSFEPTIDYIVTKVPRFAFEKFSDTPEELNSSMKSVGEVMAIGRSFNESLQKALRGLESSYTGLNEIYKKNISIEFIKEQLTKCSPKRLFCIADAMRRGISIDEIYEITKVDKWFLRNIANIIELEKIILSNGVPKDYFGLMQLKQEGFSDLRIAELSGLDFDDIVKLRNNLAIKPLFKKVDTCAAEFNSETNYIYSCYEGNIFNGAECEANITNKEKIVIIGSGPNRIGQGIEFDYACVHASMALREIGYETIMVNCNPETVSTDYDISDKLYFEPITEEDVLEILAKESSTNKLLGVIVQFGGQTPLKVAHKIEEAGYKVLGTPVSIIDLAEDRERFKDFLHKLNLSQPKNFICYSTKEVYQQAKNMGYPILVRPSYVLGGRAMEIIYDQESLEDYFARNTIQFKNGPILIDSFLTDALEIDADAISDGNNVYVAGIMQHVQEAGVHSGDSAFSLPPYSIPDKLIQEIFKQTQKIGTELQIIGLMNIQFAIKDDNIYILEVNLRSSRSIPFVAKATGIPLARVAAQIIAGKKLSEFNLHNQKKYITTTKDIAVKESVFPFIKFPYEDIILGPEMKSTGEVMGISSNFEQAFAKSQIASGTSMPKSGIAFLSVKDGDKQHIVSIAKDFIKLGFEIIATRGTLSTLVTNNIEASLINKVVEGEPHIVDIIKNGSINIIINTTEGKQAIIDSASIRKTALMMRVPCITTMSGARAFLRSIKELKSIKKFEVNSLQSYFKN